MMTDENGILSIDFLAGFTIFMLAFIWVVSMIPGLLIGLQSYTIDYDAVAYRTGVILVEDPGWPVSPPWESYTDLQTSNVTRFGLAISKDTPNILSQDKVNRFFCTTFKYDYDYRTRVIFGDYRYGFNISLIDLGGQNRSVGDVLPGGYGTIRRLVKIKGASNATINNAKYTAYPHSYINTDNVTTHVFSILIDNPKLLGDVTDPVYQIDPAREQIMINITDLRSTITNYPPIINNTTSTITLRNIIVVKREGGAYSSIPLLASEFLYIDGSSAPVLAMPTNVTDNVTLRFSPSFFNQMKAQNSQIYIALGFDLNQASTFLNNTQALNILGLPDFDNLDGNLTFNNPNTAPFDYNYDPNNVTQPYLRDAVVEVAVWSGVVTGSISGGGGGGGGGANGSYTIYATAGSGGAIAPSGAIPVASGANQAFTITPNAGYHITDVVVNTSYHQGAVTAYTFNNVVQDHTIAASFAINTYTITASAGANGAISPPGVTTVNYGSTPVFTFTPASGYLANVIVDGGAPFTPAGNSYTFPAVTANHTINASFAQAPPVASFNTIPSPAIGAAPLVVTFNDTSTGGAPSAWDWDFGDGSPHSAVQNPSHTYTVAGPFTAQLTVSNFVGSSSATKPVTVTPAALVANFTGTPTSGSAPLTVAFTDTSTNTPISWIWEYQNATVPWTQFSTAQNPSYIFPVGTYDIRLNATNAIGSNTATKIGYITVSAFAAPVAAFSGTPVWGLAPLNVQFTDSSSGTPSSWKWEYQNATSPWTQFSTAQNPLISFPTGTYDIRLNATNAGGSNTSTKTEYIKAYSVRSSATAPFGGSWTVPAGVTTVEYIVVAGGGGGGRYGAGGGAGGFLTGTLTGLSGSQTVTVGSGGAGSTSGNNKGSNGGNSVFGTINATGGGGGGSTNNGVGAAGGSGGGGVRSGNAGGAGTAGQGNAGGAGSTSGGNYYGGGGGGAGGTGVDASGTVAGNGGAGSLCSIDGVTYAGGGGGGANSAGTAGTATNGGGAGGDGAAGSNAQANTGGGGGGGGYSGGNYDGGNGGSGIVIIRYY